VAAKKGGQEVIGGVDIHVECNGIWMGLADAETAFADPS
jgi:hypothetical protein